MTIQYAVSESLDFLKDLNFFLGWLCSFKGLFISVWREIHQSKTLLTCSRLSHMHKSVTKLVSREKHA